MMIHVSTDVTLPHRISPKVTVWREQTTKTKQKWKTNDKTSTFKQL